MSDEHHVSIGSRTDGRHDNWLAALLAATLECETNDVGSMLCNAAFRVFVSPLAWKNSVVSHGQL